jgi:hypothetical protein
MSRLLAILFVLIMSAQAVHQGLIYTYYSLNKNYIVANLCENKDTVELKCNGKCHLGKILSVGKKTDKNLPAAPNLEEIKVPLLFFQEITAEKVFSVRCSLLHFTSQSFRYLFSYDFVPITNIFHPPQ